MIQRYFERTRNYSTRRFIIELAVVGFVSKIPLAVLYSMLGGRDTRPNIDLRHPAATFIAACAVAPIVETVIGQWLPIWFIGLFTASRTAIIWISALLFAALHAGYGIGVSIILMGASLVLSWSFVLNRETSRWRAFWVTLTIHSLHNLISTIFAFATH